MSSSSHTLASLGKSPSLPDAFHPEIYASESTKAMSDYYKLLTNNKEWQQEKTKDDPDYFKRMAEGQRPRFLLIGCSDSRVPPDQLTKTQPGEIFIHRNVANLVVSTDINLMSVLQYAVEVLKVKHVIVMGHTNCGGIRAAMGSKPLGLIDRWLSNIKDVYRLHLKELDAIKDENQRTLRYTECVVEEQVFNLYKTEVIQRAWARGQKVYVHGWLFNIEKGLIRDLEIEKTAEFQDIAKIYQYEFDIDTASIEASPIPLKKYPK